MPALNTAATTLAVILVISFVTKYQSQRHNCHHWNDSSCCCNARYAEQDVSFSSSISAWSRCRTIPLHPGGSQRQLRPWPVLLAGAKPCICCWPRVAEDLVSALSSQAYVERIFSACSNMCTREQQSMCQPRKPCHSEDDQKISAEINCWLSFDFHGTVGTVSYTHLTLPTKRIV